MLNKKRLKNLSLIKEKKLLGQKKENYLKTSKIYILQKVQKKVTREGRRAAGRRAGVAESVAVPLRPQTGRPGQAHAAPPGFDGCERGPVILGGHSLFAIAFPGGDGHL